MDSWKLTAELCGVLLFWHLPFAECRRSTWLEAQWKLWTDNVQRHCRERKRQHRSAAARTLPKENTSASHQLKHLNFPFSYAIVSQHSNQSSSPLVHKRILEVSQQVANKEVAFILQNKPFLQHDEPSAMRDRMADCSFHCNPWSYHGTQASKPKQGFYLHILSNRHTQKSSY